MLNRVAVLALAVACGGDATAPSTAPNGSGAAVVDAATVGVGANSAAERSADVGGAIAAWQAVVDRALYLERRGSAGVVRGVVGPQAGPLTWLVDETEGSGSLAIRVLVPSQVAVAPGDRIAAAGAWSLDESRNWYWRASRVTALPSVKMPQTVVVGRWIDHSIIDGDMPPTATPISLAKQGDPAYFAVVGDPPVLDGDGWLVADTPRAPPYALINMPGERASFGGQDFRTPSERWSLQRGETYWVRIGPVRRRAADKLATMNARTPPVRVTRSASQTGR